MLRFTLAVGAVLLSSQALAISVSIYGHVDIGGLPQPPVVLFPQAVVIERGPVALARPPLYLHVPPGHSKHWNKHCRSYNACGRPVYFVEDGWYDRVYVPHRKEHGPKRHERHERHEDRGRGHDKGHGKGHH